MKKLLIAIFSCALMVLGVSAPVFADEYNPVCAEDSGVDAELRAQAGCTETRELTSVAATVINIAIFFIAIVAVIVIILGGVQFATSLGDPTKTTQGRNMLLYGVIGLAVAVLAWTIVNFVIGAIPSA